MIVAERAPAKLNLYLHVIGRRPDGYHLLDSLVAFADIGDEIRAAPAAALGLALAGPFAEGLPRKPEDNLVWHAALLLARHLGRSPGAALTLVKNLPVASGIGGGSSDAAAALRALLALWGGALDRGTLAALAARLGADVPVCLDARAAWLGGIGDAVEPAPPLPATHVVLANPGIALPTPAVYQSRRGDFSAPARFAMPADAAHLAALLAERRNDLTAAAIALVPEIGVVLARLAAAEGACIARMSGSGATCFALFATAATAAAAAARLRREEPRWWVAAGRLT
ncbi:MAG TPA: 4-(cytidine 5'-diphospho)-2-C-methyl-D-erythritol kinase [Stellaceae bacterium]|nr:4-(cytidine 5'-diphospho)-2-C-methyl-D-erythritol kinase [Stellaceae bacterium]